ncbi:MAG: site-specific DNA-methyltransferase [Polaromonas sp.]|nr:site-specific DNA-methyltransferase [Polaromonas sp.]
MPSLSWLHKQNAEQAATKVPHHLLTVQSVHGDATAGNLLIQGDNLLALKALLPAYRGRVKCIFIDPPYNTQSAFAHYNDKLEHSLWLTMMLPRLQLLRDLLSEDGSIWVTIDDNEGHYLKVLMDEVFGRENFIGNVIWHKKYSPQNDDRGVTAAHDHVIAFAKSKPLLQINLLPRTAEMDARYANPDNDPKGPWKSGDLTSKTKANGHSYPITGPDGIVHLPSPGRQWAPSLETFERWSREKKIWFGKNGTSRPSIKQYLNEVQAGIVPLSIWFREEVGDNQEAKKEITVLNSTDIFDTPKPERLLLRALSLATNPGDLVLDSFLGSGTTAAVAHKMGRRWIGIEMGEHARTHCLPRLEKVVAGEQGGISKTANWLGGGGFRFLTLGNAIFDELGRIDTSVVFTDLAAFVWQQETSTPAVHAFTTPCLGVHDGTQYFLLFNGILGDKRPEGGNVLTYEVFDALVHIYPFDGPRVVFGEAVKLPPTLRVRERVTFKKIPYSLRGQGAM